MNEISPPNNLEVSVRIDVRQQHYGNGQLSLNHSFNIRADSFSDVAAVLMKYDELSKAIEAANKR